MRTRHRNFAVGFGLLLVPLPIWAAITVLDGDAVTTTTAAVAVVPGVPADELQQIAEEWNVSLAAAERMLLEQTSLLEFAHRARTQPGYAGFKVVTSGETVRGVLVVTRGTTIEVPAGLPVDVIVGRFAEADFRAIQIGLSESLQDIGHEPVIGVTYDPFDDTLIVWLGAQAPEPTTGEAAEIEASLRSILNSEFEGVAIRIALAPQAELAGG